MLIRMIIIIKAIKSFSTVFGEIMCELAEEDEQKVLIVYTDFRDPEPGLTLAQELTYPLQVAETDLTALPDRIELKVQYAE